MALSDTIAARLEQQRNPNLGTDNGLNSVSPYFLPTGQTRASTAAGWQETNASLAASQAQGFAAKRDAATLRASQAAAAAASQKTASDTAAAQVATDLQNTQDDTLRRAAISNAKMQDNLLSAQQQRAIAANPTQGVQGIRDTGAKGQYSVAKGLDTQGTAALQTARAYGYNLGAANYSKTYNNNPNLSAARNKAMMLATSYLGTRYVLGGESHQTIDCSGLVQSIYTQLGYRVPTHSSADQGQTGGRSNGNGIPGQRMAFGSRAMQPGDLVAWRDGSHIAIYAGNGMIIEAANEKVGTVKRPLWDSPSNVVGIHLNI